MLTGYPTVSTHTIAEVDAKDYAAMVIPGGFAPDYMRRSDAMKAAIVQMLSEGKPIAAICHGREPAVSCTGVLRVCAWLQDRGCSARPRMGAAHQ